MENFLYRDSLLSISENEIIFERYGLGGSARNVPLNEILKITCSKPTFWNGRYRYHGTGDFKTWFPVDSSRTKRDMIFFAHFNNKWRRVGFTVEDAKKFIEVLKQLNLFEEKA